MNLEEFAKIEERARIVSAWKYLPWWKRKVLRAKFQLEVLRLLLPKIVNFYLGEVGRGLAVFVAVVFFLVTPFPRSKRAVNR